MIIGLCGYGKSGKDTALEEMRKLSREPWERIAFADPLKQDLAPLFDTLREYYPELDLNNPEHKRLLRPLYECWGTVICRRFAPDIWIKRAEISRQKLMKKRGKDVNIAFTDVRNINEVEYVHSLGGSVAYIARPGVVAAGEMEAATIPDCLTRYPAMRGSNRITNSGTKEELGLQLLSWIDGSFGKNMADSVVCCGNCGKMTTSAIKCSICKNYFCCNTVVDLTTDTIICGACNKN